MRNRSLLLLAPWLLLLLACSEPAPEAKRKPAPKFVKPARLNPVSLPTTWEQLPDTAAPDPYDRPDPATVAHLSPLERQLLGYELLPLDTPAPEEPIDTAWINQQAREWTARQAARALVEEELDKARWRRDAGPQQYEQQEERRRQEQRKNRARESRRKLMDRLQEHITGRRRRW